MEVRLAGQSRSEGVTREPGGGDIPNSPRGLRREYKRESGLRRKDEKGSGNQRKYKKGSSLQRKYKEGLWTQKPEIYWNLYIPYTAQKNLTCRS